MLSVSFGLIVFVACVQADKRAAEMQVSLMEPSSPSSSSPVPLDYTARTAHHADEDDDEGRARHAPRVPRGSKPKGPRDRHEHRHPRPHPDPDAFFTTPRTFNGSLRVHNPLYPLTEESYSAYAVMLLALIVFSVGIVGNLALMCIVWHNYYLKSTWNCVLASLAFWDFMVLFFCLPVVIFNELTKRRLMGDLSCRIVPYVEVTSLGVTTFTLCALSIDRFHAVTSVQPRTRQIESCQSILAKLSVIWVGSLILATPELLMWQLEQEVSPRTGLPVDSCTQQAPLTLPETLYSLVLTYHQARMWWTFGCFFCLPLLFTGACQLLTRHVTDEAARSAGKPSRPSSTSSSSSSASSSPKKQRRERQLTQTVVALASVYAVCSLPEYAWNIVLAYAGVEVDAATRALLALIGQFLLFVRAGATPVLLLCICRSLGQAFMDCCCCCCDECLPDPSSSSTSSSSSTNATAVSSSLSSPVSLQEEKLKIVSGTSPAVFFDKVKDSPSELIIGTPC